MAKIYLVCYQGSNQAKAAFTFPELAKEYAEQQSVEKFRDQLHSLNQILEINPFDNHKRFERLGLPKHSLFSEYSDEEILKIAREFGVTNLLYVYEVELIA